MRGRVLLATGILAAWFGGLGVLVRREYFRPQIERLAEAALRVTPDAVFYAVLQGDRQVGFASSTLDTASTTIEQRDYLVADIPVDGGVRRAEMRTNVILTRTLRVKSFDVQMDTDREPLTVTGEVVGDSVIRVAVTRSGAARPDSQVIRTAGAILLPTLVPLAVALGERPKVGNSVTLPVFEPAAVGTREVRVDVRAESLFVVNDSSVFDSVTGRWKGALPDTVRGWQLVSQGGTGIGGWVDEQGRLITSSQLGFQLERRPYEVAFENWKLESDTGRQVMSAVTPANRNIVVASLLAAGKHAGASLSELRVRVSGIDLRQVDLVGGRQRLSGDTLTIRTEDVSSLAPRYIAIRDPRERARNADLQDEPFLEVDHAEIQAAAARIASFNRNPRSLALSLHAWVRDSLRGEATAGIPSALHVLHTRRGDANEYTQLFVALARAAGVPARVATGLLYVDGKFYSHAWPEIMLRGWVAVDPMLGQFPADAAHLRLVTGGPDRQNELPRMLHQLKLEVVSKR